MKFVAVQEAGALKPRKLDPKGLLEELRKVCCGLLTHITAVRRSAD